MKKALWISLFACGLLALPAVGIQPPRSPAQEKFYRHPDLYVPELTETLSSLAPSVATALAREADALGATPDSVFYDSRVGRWSSLILRYPLIPGHGDGNSLRWPNGAAPKGEAAFHAEVWNALRAYLERHKDVLRLDLSEISDAPRIASYRDRALIFVFAPRVVDGIPVRDNSIGAAVNSGNLILLGVQKWGDVDVSRAPSIDASAAEAVVRSHAAPLPVPELVNLSHLELVPLSGPSGIHYRLAWVVTCRIENDLGTWEGLVDAANGTLLAFEDKNQYADSKVVGGVYPVSNDHRPPDGNEQAGYPMPFVDFTVDGVKQYSDTGGNLGCIPGSISTALDGLYMRMLDTCGAINETGTGTLDLGFGPGALSTDCAIPSGHSAGDTKSSRSGYYELNRIAEQARGYLDGETDPGAIWVREQLTAVMNINLACNANWNGATVNFFRSSPANGCRNTGEIAAIFDHEWGHGMDNNGVNPNIAGPGEAVADIYAALRLNTSCIGRGFFTNRVCDGYGDACDGTPTTGCTGVRDIDYENHRCDQPHTISWITGGFTSGQCGGTGSAPACPTLGSTGPCNRETHCEGMVMAETGWDLMTRDLLDPPFNYDSQTAHEIATRLLFFAAQGVGNWYTCSVGGGCSATGGYLSVLAADDDDGNLSNGTPHMTAIRASFERHEIHCATPAVANSGCAVAPVDAPTVTLAGQDRAIAVSWTAVADAATYVVYRGEGIDPCDFGKIIIAETSELTFLDRGLSNGRDYSYAVMAVGANGACFGPQSACVSGEPVAGANFAFSGATQLSGGDLDPFLDNCETATVSFSVTNIGQTDLTNVQILSVTAVTHPLTQFLTTFPAPISATLASCETAAGSFQIVPQGLTFDGDSDFLVTIAADELGSDTRTKLIRLSHTESDLAPVTSQIFSFEADTDGWSTVSGTFNRVTGAGGNGTNAHLSSSSGAHDRCDVTRSPLIALSDTSTLTMYVRYDIEPVDGGVHWDRANVSLVDAAGNRTVVRPSSGRVYNVPNGAANGTCGTGNQPGWNGMSPTYPAFLLSSWTSAALNPGGSFTGETVALQVNYGTDELVAGQGFDFDEVTLTNFQIQVPDAHSDDCALATQVEPTGLAVDEAGNGVLELGEVAAVAPAWENIGLNAIDLTATITDFSGPAGPTYTVTDGAAAYGTLVPGDAASCTDCYAVEITAVARPQPHWDALLTEVTADLSAQAAAFQKIWTLHVGESFTDVPTSSSFYTSIETVMHNGVTAGCGDGTAFCPADTVTRQQMAVFLLKAKEGAAYTPPACTVPVFSDVPCSSPFAPWINELAARAVTAGCGDGTTYCPTDPTNRQQMAVFLLKTEEGSSYTPPVCSAQVFDDVPCSSPFAPWINELVARSVTAGCGGNNYCPGNQVARQQMAVFLTKTFGLVLYGV